jgi:hypothetical protein
MNNVKKVYLPLIELLENNQNKKVSTLLPEILELVQSKQVSRSYKTDENGCLTHVFCYYHKLWEPVNDVEFGSKRNTATGLNTMCKEGLSNWTKQQREYRRAKENILDKVANGTIAPQDIDTRLAELEKAKQVVHPRLDGIGYDAV